MNKAKIREAAKKLNPIDDTLFCKMAEDIEFCQEIIQTILKDNKLKVISNTPQFTAKNMQGRSCILDLKCILGDGRLVNVEVQRADDDDHQRRVLYNASLLITNTLNPSTKFSEVPEIILVFISEFDTFRAGKTIYHVSRVLEETGAVVYNGMKEIYVNAEVDDKSDIADLMRIFKEDAAYDDKKFPVTSSSKRRYKTTEKGVSEMCEIMENIRKEAVLETLADLVKEKLLTPEKAAEKIGMSLSDFTKAIAVM